MLRFRNFALALLILTIGSSFFFFSGEVSAQDGDAVQVLKLSKSGYEQALSLSFSSDGKILAVGGMSGIYLYDFPKLSKTSFIQTNTWARSVTFMPGTALLAAGLFDSTIKFWNIPDLNLTKTFSGPSGWVRSISRSADGSLIASASDDDILRVWSVSDGAIILALNNNTGGLRAVALAPDGKRVAGAMADKTVRVWSVPDGQLLYSLSGHTDWVRNLAFSPSGNLLASGSFDKNVLLWNMDDGSLFKTLQGHTSSILSLAFSPDGATLASGSVDETIRLWNVSTGSSLQLLQGHAGFVYSLAFSADGRTLASGGSDNAVRLWDLAVFGKAAPGQDLTGPATSSDCRDCHHPRGVAAPPRVAHMSCETCHANGASLSWCPIFPRSAEAATTIVMSKNIPQAGIAVGSQSMAVQISSPANGETLYSNRRYIVPAAVTGKVFFGGQSQAGVTVQLDVWIDDHLSTSETIQPETDGEFEFNLSLNPAGNGPPVATKPSALDCVNCHDDFTGKNLLAAGEYRLAVTAVARDGSTAHDERWIKVDVSEAGVMAVQVIDSSSGEAIPGLPVQAKTVFYEWKGQYAQATTDQQGNAQLDLDLLSRVKTTYTLNIQPYVLDGVLYAGDEPVVVTLEPGKKLAAPITIKAHSQVGSIRGVVTGDDSQALPTNLSVWAIQVPAGPAYRTTLKQPNVFDFAGIPVSQYLVVTDDLALAQQGLAVPALTADLFKAPAAELSLSLLKSSPLSGKITAVEGDFLPFAWLTYAKPEIVRASDPTSGRFLIRDLPQEVSYVTASAPGYYSLPLLKAQKDLDFKLALRPETAHVVWGTGSITLPPETVVTVKNLDFNMQSGWLWGQAGPASQPAVIHLPAVDILISAGKFALESPPEGQAWLYIYEGQALVTFAGQSSLTVSGGQMLVLQVGAKPLALESAVALALHPVLKQLPVVESIEPTLSARIQSWLAQTGIGAMQMITFITYILSLVTLIVIPLFGLSLYWKKKRNALNPQEKK